MKEEARRRRFALLCRRHPSKLSGDSSRISPTDAVAVARSKERDGNPVAEILIVDDEPDMRFILKMAFEAAGHRIVEAHHGVAALERVEDSRPDLVVTDLMMPVLDGLELIRRLRSDPETATIPILVLSSRATVASGADAALAKPFRPHEVLAAGLSLMRSEG